MTLDGCKMLLTLMKGKIYRMVVRPAMFRGFEEKTRERLGGSRAEDGRIGLGVSALEDSPYEMFRR